MHLVATILVLCVAFYELYTRHRARHLPPGFSGFRCLFEIPKGKPWLKVLEMNQKYGDIACASLCGYNMIVIGSPKIAGDLLEKRKTNYVDRPRSIMGGELSGWGKMMLLCNYTDWFCAQRKWLAQEIGNHVLVSNIHRMIEFETRRALQSMLDDTDNVQAYLRKNFGSIALRLSHGYVTKDGEDPLVELAELANSQLSQTTTPGNYHVDLAPVLKYIPSWFPGAGFKRRAKEYAAVLHDTLEIPHKYATSQIAAGTALPSLSSRLLSMPGLTPEREENIKWTTLTMFRAGVDTSVALSYAFLLAMTLYPRVMKKAQEELDLVVGVNRLPTFADRPSLPYMEAVFTELLRWHSPGPTTLRCSRADDEYDGYLIPAGSYVIVNIWAMLRDERTYSNPLEFKPERFLGDAPEPAPFNVCFGFGRRRCPGRYFAYSTLWLMCAQFLAVFEVSKRVENGVEVTPEFNQVGGTLLHVAPFKCAIKPRREMTERLLKEEFTM